MSHVTQLVKIVRDRNIIKLCSVRQQFLQQQQQQQQSSLERDLVAACHAEGLTDVHLIDDPVQAHGLLVDSKEGGRVYPNGQTVFEVSRFTQPQFENNDLVSVVFDIETVNVNPHRPQVFIDDTIVCLVMTTCIVTEPIDTVYLTTVDPKVESWERVHEQPQPGSSSSNRFMSLYTHMITSRYKDDKGRIINVVYCRDGEKQLLNAFIVMINLIRPHNLVSFNGESFDLPFLVRSCFRHDIDLAVELSLLQHPKSAYSSSASVGVIHSGTQQIQSSRKKFHCVENRRGFIKKDVLEMRHDSFNAFISTDLCKYNQGSLDEVCKTKLKASKINLPYTEIPAMVASAHEKLFIYNVRDVDLTTALFIKDYFLCIRYYCTLERLNSTWWDVSSSMARSAPAYQAAYSTNERFGFVTTPVLKPGRVAVQGVFKELMCYFLVHHQNQDLTQLEYENTRHLLYEYHNGNLDVRKDLKKVWPFTIKGDGITAPSSTASSSSSNNYDDDDDKHPYIPNFMLTRQLQERKKGSEYTTIDLLVLLSLLSNGTYEQRGCKVLAKHCIEGIWELFQATYEFTESKRAVLEAAEYDKLCQFIWYLTTVHRYISPNEQAGILWNMYNEHAKTTTANVQTLKDFYTTVLTRQDGSGRITRQLYDAVVACQSHYRPKRFKTPQAKQMVKEMMHMLTRSELVQKQKITLGLKMLAYDGAFIADPIKGINTEYPVVVVDIASQYPSCTLALNMSPQTEITLDRVFEYDLVEGQDFYAINHRRCDDQVNFREYLEKDMIDYVKWNYTFFLTELPDQSRLAPSIVQYTNSIRARLSIKKQIKTAPTEEARRSLTEMSDSFKVDINSAYGVLGLVSGIPKFMACVTAMGRKTIHNIRNTLKQLYRDDLVIRYGDSVTADTPILIRTYEEEEGDNDGHGHHQNPQPVDEILPISQLAFKYKTEYDRWRDDSKDGKYWGVMKKPVYVWTDKGWTLIRCIVRHKLGQDKKLVRVSTRQGCVDVTEDHSLLTMGGGGGTGDDASHPIPSLPITSHQVVKKETRLLHNNNHYIGRRNAASDFIECQQAQIIGFFLAGAGYADFEEPSDGPELLPGQRKQPIWRLSHSQYPKMKKYLGWCQAVYPQFKQDDWQLEAIHDDIDDDDEEDRQWVVNLNTKHDPGLEKSRFVLQFMEFIVPNWILNGSNAIREYFFEGVFDVLTYAINKDTNWIETPNKTMAAQMYQLGKSLGYYTTVTANREDSSISNIPYRVDFNSHHPSTSEEEEEEATAEAAKEKDDYVVQDMWDVTHLYAGDSCYVYDLTTENSHFGAGIGDMIVHNTDSVFFSMQKTVDEILRLSIDEALDYFNGTAWNHSYGTIVTRDQVEKIYGAVVNDDGIHREKSDYYRCCYIIQHMFESVVPILDARNPKQVKLEIEKVMIPTVQCSRKKYAADIPLMGKTLTKGLSNASRVSLKATRQLLDRFLSLLKSRDSACTDYMLDLYHYIGRQFLIPMAAGTIDLSLISKNVSHNTTKHMTNKAANMLQRMQEEDGTSFFFDTVKETIVNIQPIGKDKEWSRVTVDQFLANREEKDKNEPYKLHLEKNLKDIMSEFMSLIAVDNTVDTGIMFEALPYGHYEPDLERMPTGNGQYEVCSSSSTVSQSSTKRKMADSDGIVKRLRREAVARTQRRSKTLPAHVMRRRHQQQQQQQQQQPKKRTKQTKLTFASKEKKLKK